MDMMIVRARKKYDGREKVYGIAPIDEILPTSFQQVKGARLSFLSVLPSSHLLHTSSG